MKIKFGHIDRYIDDKGFGFLTDEFDSIKYRKKKNGVFFHIKTLRRADVKLAEKLESKNVDIESAYFWYEVEDTQKGEQFKSIIPSNKIPKLGAEELAKLEKRLMEEWNDNPFMYIFSGLFQATVDVFGKEKAEEMKQTQEKKQEELEAEAEKQRNSVAEQIVDFDSFEDDLRVAPQPRMITRKIDVDIETRLAHMDAKEKEFQELVKEMKPFGFTEASQVSRYIMMYRLGEKYPNISGVVRMERDGDTWDYHGGFPADIYAKLCNALGIRSRGTTARAIGFTAFKDISTDNEEVDSSKL